MFQRFGDLLYIIGEHCTECWIFSNETCRPLTVASACFHIHQSILHRKENGFCRVEYFGVERAQGRIVVEDVKAPAESCHNQIGFALLYGKVFHGYIGYSRRQLGPDFSAVEREKDIELGACKKQVGIYGILNDGMYRFVVGQITDDGNPRLPFVVALEQIRFEIVAFDVVERGVNRICIET